MVKGHVFGQVGPVEFVIAEQKAERMDELIEGSKGFG